MNNIIVIGRLTKNPELRYLQSGTAAVRFTVAVNRDYKNKDGSITTDFIPVEIMGKPAEFTANYITKGRLVAINGSIRVDRYETEGGEKRTFTKIQGRNIESLESKKVVESNNANNIANPNNSPDHDGPKFEPSNFVSPDAFSAVDDEEVPF